MKTKITLVALSLFVLNISIVFSQAPVKQWDACYGGSAEDDFYDLAQTADGGYIFGGASESGISGDKSEASFGDDDFWIVKTDASGVKQWDQRYGGSDDDYFITLQPTTDGGYILGGKTFSGISGNKSTPAIGGKDFWIVKIDANGGKQWDATFGGDDDEALFGLQQTSDGGYIMGGPSRSGISGDKTQASQGKHDYWIVKTDPNGNKEWDARYGGHDDEFLKSLIQTKDGGYLLGGTTYSDVSGDVTEPSRGDGDYWIVKTDPNGVKQWDARFGGDGDDDLKSVLQTKDGGYILGGSSRSGISGDKTVSDWGQDDYWIVKVDANGVKQWDARYGGTGEDLLKSVIETNDGGFIFAGYSSSGIGGDKTQGTEGGNDYWIVKTDANGVKQWDARYGGSGSDDLKAIKQTTDGGFILGGKSYSDVSGEDKSENGWGDADFWVVKISGTDVATGVPTPNLNQSGLSVFPNPAKAQFNIDLQLPQEGTIATTIEVINILGQAVYSDQTSTDSKGRLTQQIELNKNVPEGNYMVKVTANNLQYSARVNYQK